MADRQRMAWSSGSAQAPQAAQGSGGGWRGCRRATAGGGAGEAAAAPAPARQQGAVVRFRSVDEIATMRWRDLGVGCRCANRDAREFAISRAVYQQARQGEDR
ncbi:hypothetical protein Syun_031377 [Stephania yunnanensis]|uniref:Uncharacterized protein n=1 Tax=Stephania yunnanensis TaxID=152371 RepID=A0AAP0HBS5_9MAGN